MFLNVGSPLILPILFALVWAVAIGFILWFKNKATIARTASMQALSQTLGLSFSHKDSFGLARQLQGFNLFQRERRRWFRNGKITNVLRGLVGETEVFLFDYTYTIQAGNTPKRISQTVFFANNKNWFLPNFHLKPEKWWHKLQAKLGMSSDINFEENPKFSDKFWLKGTFEEQVRQQFTPALQGFLTEKPPAHLEGSNYYLIGYKPRKKMDAPEAKLFFQHCCEIVQMLEEKGYMELLDLAELKKEAVAEAVVVGSNRGQ
ncbi:MAG: hypothetical protein H7246_07280 [Phycisphaerae bacterium]|nr:hypothetical protein [Saprospiraceae bacterium]